MDRYGRCRRFAAEEGAGCTSGGEMLSASMKLLQRVAPPSAGTLRLFEDAEIEQSIPERFEQQVRAQGERLAVRWDGGSYTYSSLNEKANRLARTLLARQGALAEPVALLFDHGGEVLAAILAVLKSGKFYVVLDPGHPPERLAHMLVNSGALLMVAGANHREFARQLCGNAVELVQFDAVDQSLSAADLASHPSPDDLALILYTSGSTGVPKGAMHTHRSVLVDVRNLTNGLCVTSRDRWLLYASIGFATGVRTIYSTLLNGASVFPFDIRKGGFGALAAWMLESEITIVAGVPTFFRSFMGTLDSDRDFPEVRILWLGGEQMLGADLAYFNRHFAPHCVLVHAFGPTESLTVCWALVPHGTPIVEGKLPIGRSLPDKEVLLLDESRREVGAGEVGEIAVRSRHVSPGYWRDPERTRLAFLPDPRVEGGCIYMTGDLGVRGPDGILTHVGRRDFQVKIRGFRVEVSEIEIALRAVKGVRDAVVVGREMKPGDMRLVAYFVASGDPPVSARWLRECLAQSLPDYMMPAAVVAIDAFPQTPNGKTDRLRLPPPTWDRGDLEEPLKEPRNAIEVDLVAVWKSILGIEQLGIDDDFLSLGGNSLHAARIAADATSRYRIEVPASAPLRWRTVARMAEALAVAGDAHGGIDAVRLAGQGDDWPALNGDDGESRS
jgi:amino acid adenylation domain-containing protein